MAEAALAAAVPCEWCVAVIDHLAVPCEWCVQLGPLTATHHSQGTARWSITATHHSQGTTAASATSATHSPGAGAAPPTGGAAPAGGVQQSISPQVLTKAWRPPLQCRQWSVHCLGDTNTCGIRYEPASSHSYIEFT